jgi:hypothetical protein
MSTTPTQNGGNELKKKTEAEFNQIVLYVSTIVAEFNQIVLYVSIVKKTKKQGKRGMLYLRKRSPPHLYRPQPHPNNGESVWTQLTT